MDLSIFLIITIIPMIIVILYYFGIIRYFKLHIDSHKSYIEKYKNLNKASANNRVILSFTSTPSKVNKIKPMIKSILDQTVKVDQIVLNLPKNNNNNYNIPNEYNDMLNIFYCNDYGEATKIIPTLLREDNSDTIIILLNDDYIYGKDFIETMIEESNKNDEAIIYDKGILIKTKFFDPDSILDRKEKYLKDDWILNNIKHKKKYIKYRENFKSFAI